jgi:arylsulfatase A-like enzyme
MNVLWITTDHQQWQTIAGRSACQTPNIQRLINGGMLFNRSYTPMPVCCPVRAMWMSGAFPWHNGVFTQVDTAPSISRDMYPDVVTYAQRLREAGYRTGFLGKWHASHMRSPLDFGFDELSHPQACPSWTYEGGNVVPDPPLPPGLGELRYTPVGRFAWPGSETFDMWGYYEGPIERLNTTRLTDSAIAMLRRFAQDEQPWHIAVHFPEPHDPYNPHKQYLDMYDPEALPVPPSFYDAFEGKPGMHRREASIWGDVSEQDVRQGVAHFFAYCTQIDEQIGRILDALEESGQADDTLIAFTTDHGDMLGAHHMWTKSWMPYEEVWRIPMVVRLPGVVPAAAGCDHLVQTHDLPHTFLQLAGAQTLPHADGRSLMPLFENPQRTDWEDALLCVGYGGTFVVIQRMVITPRFKYMFHCFDFDEMYDLQNDPGELHNLVDDPAYAAERSALRAQLYELMARYDDPYGGGASGYARSQAIGRYGAPRYLPRE